MPRAGGGDAAVPPVGGLRLPRFLGGLDGQVRCSALRSAAVSSVAISPAAITVRTRGGLSLWEEGQNLRHHLPGDVIGGRGDLDDWNARDESGAVGR